MLNYETLYQELLLQLESCDTGDLSPPVQLQQSFAYSYLALNRLDLLFKDMNGEKEKNIYFLKHIRPLFLKEVYYYELVYFATLFVPEEKSEALPFWKRECLRLERFQQQHPEFCRYYRSEQTDEDEKYFTCIGRNQSHLDKLHGCRDDLIRGDCLAGQLLALERYCSYVRRQVTRMLLEVP